MALQARLQLDELSIKQNELSHNTLIREISSQKKPNFILRKLMSALESMRAGKGMGWSRAWNKYDLNVFRTHTGNMEEDQALLKQIKEVLTPFLDGFPKEYKGFFEDLISDPKLMLFTFYHNRTVDGQDYEGLTLSLGRKVPSDRSKRDRFDLVLEDKREQGSVDQKLDLVRIYCCPWHMYQNKDLHLVKLEANDILDSLQALYAASVDNYHQWKVMEERQWAHWSTRYIEYFGPRSFIPKGSSFT